MAAPVESHPDPIECAESASNTLAPRNSVDVRALCVPELVDIIFSFSRRSDNARHAQVCKMWSSIALKIIWEEVDDLVALFSILSPMVAGSQPTRRNVYDFVHVPSITAWCRFETYAVLVRKLVYAPTDPGGEGSKKRITRGVLRDIAQTRTRLDIFPNMHTLQWIPALLDDDMNSSSTPIPSDCILFMHPRVKFVEFYLHKSIHVSRMKYFLDEIPLRTLLLTEIVVRSGISVSSIESSICGLAASLTMLQKISLPEGYLTTRIAETLSALPALRKIQLGLCYEDAPEQLAERCFSPVIPAGRFIALKKLIGTMPFSDAAKILDKVARENGVSYLFVESPNPSCEDLRRVLEICAEKHKQLDELYLFGDNTADTGNTPVTAQTLRSIKQLSALTVLDIQHVSPVLLSVAELTSMVSALPQLSELSLNPTPLYCETAPFGLDVVPMLLQSCKELTGLSLFLDATMPLDDAELYPTEPSFARLERLTLGVSVVTKEVCHTAALYLSTRIPSGCEIIYGASWIEIIGDVVDDPHRERVRIAKERVQLWEEVESLVQFSEKVRRQESKRAGIS